MCLFPLFCVDISKLCRFSIPLVHLRQIPTLKCWRLMLRLFLVHLRERDHGRRIIGIRRIPKESFDLF